MDEAEVLLRAGMADRTMRPSSDPRAMAVLQVATSLAVLTMAAPWHVRSATRASAPEVLHRMAIPTLEFYTHGLYVDDTALKPAQATWEGAQDSPRKE